MKDRSEPVTVTGSGAHGAIGTTDPEKACSAENWSQETCLRCFQTKAAVFSFWAIGQAALLSDDRKAVHLFLQEVFMKTRFTRSERRLLGIACAVPLTAALCVPAGAMHIMEGFLPRGQALAWGAVCLP